MTNRMSVLQRTNAVIVAVTMLVQPCATADEGPPVASQRTDSARTSEPKSVKDRAGSSSVRDVQLNPNNALSLSVTDSSGQPQANVAVTVSYQGHEIARARSDKRGSLQVTGLRPGVHVVSAGQNVAMYRFWANKHAPPSSVRHPALVLNDTAMRGQYGPMMSYPMQPMMGPSMAGPGLLITGVTAAAAAVVVIGNTGDRESVVPASP